MSKPTGPEKAQKRTRRSERERERVDSPGFRSIAVCTAVSPGRARKPSQRTASERRQTKMKVDANANGGRAKGKSWTMIRLAEVSYHSTEVHVEMIRMSHERGSDMTQQHRMAMSRFEDLSRTSNELVRAFPSLRGSAPVFRCKNRDCEWIVCFH